MDIINQIITYLSDFANTSESTYHVNPWIFGILFFGSAIPLYFGYFIIAKSALKIEGKKIKRKKLDKKELKIGIAISIVAWWIPYVYVILFGKLPIGMWIIFITILTITGLLFIKTLHNKISKAEKL